MSNSLFETLLPELGNVFGENDLNTILLGISSISRQLTLSEHATVMLAEGRKLRLAFSTLPGFDAQQLIKINFSEGIPGMVASSQLPFMKKFPTPPEKSSPGVDQLQVKSILCVPMIMQDKTFGTLQVFNKTENQEFLDEDKSRLQIFANQAALAIEHYTLRNRLLQESRRVHGIFEALTDGIMVVDSVGNPIIYNKAIETLFFPDGKMNFALTTYLSTLLREAPTTGGSSEVFLLKPHNVILSNRYVAVKDHHGKVSEVIVSIRNMTDTSGVDRRFSQFYAFMLRHSNRIIGMALKTKDKKKRTRLLRKQKEILRNLVSMTEIKSGPLRIEKDNIKIVDLYTKIRTSCLPRLTRKEISLVDSTLLELGELRLRVEPRRILLAFMTLLKKGFQHLPIKSELRLDAKVDNGRLNFVVTYLGKDIHQHINPEALEWNRQVDLVVAGETKSLCFDLAFMKHIIRAHKGNLIIAADEEHKSVVTFDILME